VALVGGIVAFLVLGAVGTALTPELAAHHPLVLIVLEARDRHLLLARHVDLGAFVVVGTVRRLASDPLFYLLGRDYGADTVGWFRRHGGGRLVTMTERAFRRAAYPMLVAFPGAVVCTLAGDTGTPPVAFGVVIVIRTVLVVLLLRLAGDALARPIDAVLHLFARYAFAATLATAGAVAVWVAWESWRIRRNTEASVRDGAS
jgi:membrane protein DedA with SNARE-associated domain